MRFFTARRAFALAALAGILTAAGCASDQATETARLEAIRIEAEVAAAQAAHPFKVSLNDQVIQSAAVYLAYTRDMATLRGGFASPQEIEAALMRGAAYEPDQISRGLVSYVAVLALQSPEFVAAVRAQAPNLAARNRLVARIVADPDHASTLAGANAAAGLIIGALDAEIDALRDAADSIENDAYAIQADARQNWARQAVPNREQRIQAIKDLSGRTIQADAGQAARLSAAAITGSGLGVSTPRLREPPYPRAVTSGLALAALAIMDAAGENARANTDALQYDRVSQDCFASSKLNLYQCLAAARPSYELEFCLGRHIVRDLASCARGAAMPAAIITVGAPIQAREDPPSPAIRAQSPPSVPTQTPVVTPVASMPRPVPVPPPATPTPIGPAVGPNATPTQRLNAAPPARPAPTAPPARQN